MPTKRATGMTSDAILFLFATASLGEVMGGFFSRNYLGLDKKLSESASCFSSRSAMRPRPAEPPKRP